MIYPAATAYPIQTPSTARQSYLQMPPTITTRALHSPVVTPVTSVMVTPARASTILGGTTDPPAFGFPMTHVFPTAAFGEGAELARDLEMEIEDDVEDADVRTEVGSPELGEEGELRLPLIRTLPPIQPYGPESISEQTCRAMRGGGAVAHDVLLYGPAGVTPASVELTCTIGEVASLHVDHAGAPRSLHLELEPGVLDQCCYKRVEPRSWPGVGSWSQRVDEAILSSSGISNYVWTHNCLVNPALLGQVLNPALPKNL
ncbi:hypothetical protein FRC08_000539 [Ceratobasidium sp. 394]|nr:hypothetical protein FRC08_000539 [Ceratobasidium sp. 394]KAG9090073.1 hypothetical protein FS749_000828 [Ceratobasidium sp. UAMH 11750]